MLFPDKIPFFPIPVGKSSCDTGESPSYRRLIFRVNPSQVTNPFLYFSVFRGTATRIWTKEQNAMARASEAPATHRILPCLFQFVLDPSFECLDVSSYWLMTLL